MEKIETILLENEEKCEKTANVFREDLVQIRVGRANPHVLDKVTVDYYGTPSPINQVGNMSVVDGQCLVIAPWDKSLLKAVEKAILQANIGIAPTNDGNVIRMVFPALTLDALKKLKNAKEITEDELADFSEEVEKTITKTIEKIEKSAAEKEKDIMTV